MRVPAGVALAGVGLVLLPVLAACGAQQSSPAGALAPATPSTASAAVSPTASPTDRGDTQPTGLSTPATTAGPLKPSSLPPASLFGRGWTTRVDAGSAEDGYLGNGTPTMSRNPQDIALTVVPFGCTKRSTLPLARYVLEDTYQHGSDDGVALRLVFSSSAKATTFLNEVKADRAACATQRDAPVTFVRTIGPVVISERTDTSTTGRDDPWTELFMVRGHEALIVSAGVFSSQTSVFDSTDVARRMAALTL